MSGLDAAHARDKVKDQPNEKEQVGGLPNFLDLHKDMVQLNKSDLISTMAANPIAMNNYLAARDEEASKDSYFKTATTFLTRTGRKALGVADVSSEFEEARANGNQGIMITLYEADKNQRKFEENVGDYSSAALKTGFLFTSGKVGWGGIVAVSASDAARPSDNFGRQLTDTVLGAAKGLANRAIFMKINEQTWNPVVKGWTYGMSDRFLDNALNSKYYVNGEGKVDLDSFKEGALTALHHTIGVQALTTDAATIGISSLVLLPINRYTGGAYFNNPLAQKLTMAGVAGLTEGSLHELNRQQDRLKPIDWLRVAQKGGERAVIDTLSAVPGTHLWY